LDCTARSGDASSPKGASDAPVAGSQKTSDEASLAPSATGASQPHWTVYAVSQTPSGVKVKRAAPAAKAGCSTRFIRLQWMLF